MDKTQSITWYIKSKNCPFVFLAVQDATFYSGDKIDKKDLSTGR